MEKKNLIILEERLMELNNFDLEDLLLAAIKSEVDSNKLYTKMSKMTKNGLLQDKLIFLAAF